MFYSARRSTMAKETGSVASRLPGEPPEAAGRAQVKRGFGNARLAANTGSSPASYLRANICDNAFYLIVYTVAARVRGGQSDDLVQAAGS
jgi:hypothetical protein